MELDEFEKFVRGEREFQEKRWGVQNHLPYRWVAIIVEEIGELSQALQQIDFSPHPDRAAMRKELIQVAAVAKAMWESGKRQEWL